MLEIIAMSLLVTNVILSVIAAGTTYVAIKLYRVLNGNDLIVREEE